MSYEVLIEMFIFKQKTAYEMRMSDWSSDVCSSDLMLDNGLAYLRISSFTTETGASLDKVFAQLQKDSKGEIKGMILDLRNNPGGVLDAAVKVGDAFLTQGPIVTIKGRNPGEQPAFDAPAGDILTGAPRVVMLNRSAERRVGKECVSTCRSRGSRC